MINNWFTLVGTEVNRLDVGAYQMLGTLDHV
jgi:hypothetical protein